MPTYIPPTPQTPTQRRSNEELAEALKAAPGDADFAAALKENESVIGKREALIAELKKELSGLHASLVQAVNGNLAALDLQQPLPLPQPVAVPVGGGAGRAPAPGPQLGLDEDVGEGPEEKTEGVYL